MVDVVDPDDEKQRRRRETGAQTNLNVTLDVWDDLRLGASLDNKNLSTTLSANCSKNRNPNVSQIKLLYFRIMARELRNRKSLNKTSYTSYRGQHVKEL